MAAAEAKEILLNPDTRLLGSTTLKVDPGSGDALRRRSSAGRTSDPDLDGGWAWVVLGSAFATNLISSGVIYNSGILFVAFLDEFQESRTFTSWIMVAQSLILCITGPIASMLLSLIGPRLTTMIGGVILSSTLGLAYFANSVWFLIIDLGISGFGASLVIVANLACIARYFKAKIYMAAAINISAVGFGIMLFGVELEWAIESFGWRYSMLIQAGIVMQILVCAALVFDKSNSTNRQRRSPPKIQLAATPSDKIRRGSESTNYNSHQNERERLSPHPEDAVAVQNNSLAVVTNGSIKDGGDGPTPIPLRESLKFFGDTRFCLILVSLFLFYGCTMIVFAVIKDVSILNGAENYDIIIASMGICNAIGRVLCGLQVMFVSPPVMYMISSFISALATAGLIFANSETLSILCASLIGFFQGQQTCLQSLTLAFIFSRSMMAILFGYGLAAGGLSAVVFGPLSGYLVDSSGSYVYSLSMTSVCLLFSGIFVMISYQIHRKKIGVSKAVEKEDPLKEINSYVKVI